MDQPSQNFITQKTTKTAPDKEIQKTGLSTSSTPSISSLRTRKLLAAPDYSRLRSPYHPRTNLSSYRSLPKKAVGAKAELEKKKKIDLKSMRRELHESAVVRMRDNRAISKPTKRTTSQPIIEDSRDESSARLSSFDKCVSPSSYNRA